VAPDDRHLLLLSDRLIAVRDAPPRGRHRPSIDVLFESAADEFGARAIGVLLTGMGSDGAQGLSRLHAAGATTLAQAPETCAVNAMPRAAIALGVVSHVGNPKELAAEILKRSRLTPEGRPCAT
jgi:two-component system chemotaxis response regulator CheB